MKKLELEFRNEFKPKTNSFKVGKTTIVMTPPIDEDYWVFRIKLYKDQAIIGFPKFNTIGIGFAIEDDWNTNLPFFCNAEEIYNHISRNKLYKQITKQMCVEAITILKKAAEYYLNHEAPETIQVGDYKDFVNYASEMKKKLKIKAQ